MLAGDGAGPYHGPMSTRRWTWLRGRRDDAVVPPSDTVGADEPRPDVSGLTALLSDIEVAACVVYGRHGLPVQPGHYARSARSGEWRYLSEDLTAEERWEVILAQKPGSGWRFGSLPDLAAQADGPPDVQLASRALRSCHALRVALQSGAVSAVDLETAIRLGETWRELGAPAPAPAPHPVPTSAPKKAARSRAKVRTKPAS